MNRSTNPSVYLLSIFCLSHLFNSLFLNPPYPFSLILNLSPQNQVLISPSRKSAQQRITPAPEETELGQGRFISVKPRGSGAAAGSARPRREPDRPADPHGRHVQPQAHRVRSDAGNQGADQRDHQDDPRDHLHEPAVQRVDLGAAAERAAGGGQPGVPERPGRCAHQLGGPGAAGGARGAEHHGAAAAVAEPAEEGAGDEPPAAEDRQGGGGQGEAAASQVHAGRADEGDQEGAGHREGGQGRAGGEVQGEAEGPECAWACHGRGQRGAGEAQLSGPPFRRVQVSAHRSGFSV